MPHKISDIVAAMRADFDAEMPRPWREASLRRQFPGMTEPEYDQAVRVYMAEESRRIEDEIGGSA